MESGSSSMSFRARRDRRQRMWFGWTRRKAVQIADPARTGEAAGHREVEIAATAGRSGRAQEQGRDRASCSVPPLFSTLPDFVNA
jgi:hypothetical protein